MNIIKAKPTEIRKYAGDATPSDAHIDIPLTNMSIAFMQSNDKFIADKVFRTLPVANQSNKYYVYDKEAFLRTDVALRAPATETVGTYTKYSTDSYFCDVYGVHHDVADQLRANADPQVDPNKYAAMLVTQQLMLAKEKAFMSKFITTGVWATDSDLTSAKWSSDTTDPADAMSTARMTIEKDTGQTPNTMIVDRATHEALKKHPLIMDRVKYVSSTIGGLTNAALAQYFEVDNYYVSAAINATNAEGATTATDYVMGNKALLCYVNNNPSQMSLSAGYTFTWSGYTGMGNGGFRITNMRMEHLKSDRIEGEMSYDMKVIAPECGYLFYNTI